MAGYATMARVDGGRVRALAWAGEPPGAAHGDATVIELPGHAAGGVAAAGMEDLAPAISFGEQVGRFRDQLVMMTFFVTDPESWR